jgi:hypothetical protein
VTVSWKNTSNINSEYVQTFPSYFHKWLSLNRMNLILGTAGNRLGGHKRL